MRQQNVATRSSKVPSVLPRIACPAMKTLRVGLHEHGKVCMNTLSSSAAKTVPNCSCMPRDTKGEQEVASAEQEIVPQVR